MFFSDIKGVHYPISQIETFQVTFDQHNNKVLKVRLKDYGGIFEVVGRSVNFIEQASATVVPAQAGTLYLGHMGNNEVWFEPVLAWIIVVADEPVPVTPHGPAAGVTNDFAVVHPNGSVYAFEESHPNLLSYLAGKEFDKTQSANALKALAIAKG